MRLVDLATLTATPLKIEWAKSPRPDDADMADEESEDDEDDAEGEDPQGDVGFFVLGHCSQRRYVALSMNENPQTRIVDTATGRETDRRRCQLMQDPSATSMILDDPPRAARRWFDAVSMPAGSPEETVWEAAVDKAMELEDMPVDEELAPIDVAPFTSAKERLKEGA